jgi:hypothetical protein
VPKDVQRQATERWPEPGPVLIAMLERLIGDGIADDLAIILAHTFDGDPAPLVEDTFERGWIDPMMLGMHDFQSDLHVTLRAKKPGEAFPRSGRTMASAQRPLPVRQRPDVQDVQPGAGGISQSEAGRIAPATSWPPCQIMLRAT